MAEYFLTVKTMGFFDRFRAFIFQKNENDVEYQIEIDDESLFYPIAVTLGWTGEPEESDQAKQFLIDFCEFELVKLEAVGLNILWEELGGKEVEEEHHKERIMKQIEEVLDTAVMNSEFLAVNLNISTVLEIVEIRLDPIRTDTLNLKLLNGQVKQLKLEW